MQQLDVAHDKEAIGETWAPLLSCVLIVERYLIHSEKQGFCLILDVFVVGFALLVRPCLAVVTVEILTFCLHSIPMWLQLSLNRVIQKPFVEYICDFRPKFPESLVIGNLRIRDTEDQKIRSAYDSPRLYLVGVNSTSLLGLSVYSTSSKDFGIEFNIATRVWSIFQFHNVVHGIFCPRISALLSVWLCWFRLVSNFAEKL